MRTLTRSGSYDARSDLIIAGGGVVGLAFAVAVKDAVGPLLSVEIRDPRLGRRSPLQRVSALAAGPRRLLEGLGAWRTAADSAQPVNRMEISDTRLEDALRPALLAFENRSSLDEPFAHIVINRDLEEDLERRAHDLGVIMRREAVGEVLPGPEDIIVSDRSTSRTTRARLLVAADGARSALREAMGISTIGWNYFAKATVCTIAHELDHQGCARQHFLPEGPLALLPLRGRRSSIVWSAPTSFANELERSTLEKLQQLLSLRLRGELGTITIEDAPMQFDLRFRLARRFASRRFALIGDAAHAIHPLAGQGLNLGLRDAAALAEEVVRRARLGLDPGASEPLQNYERARRFETVAVTAVNDALHWIFQADGVIRPARDWGMGLVNRSTGLKAGLIRRAADLRFNADRRL